MEKKPEICNTFCTGPDVAARRASPSFPLSVFAALMITRNPALLMHRRPERSNTKSFSGPFKASETAFSKAGAEIVSTRPAYSGDNGAAFHLYVDIHVLFLLMFSFYTARA